MRPLLIAALTLLLAGCPTTREDDGCRPPVWTDDDDWGGDDDSAVADDDDTTPPVPDAILFEPEDGETGVSPSRAVVADFEHEGARGEITLAHDGVPVTGRTLQGSLQRLLFLSDDLLTPSTIYDATVTWPTGEHSWSFTTSASGANPVSVLPTGLTLHWTLDSSVVSPPGAEVFLAIADLELLTQITSVDDGGLQMLGAMASDGVQDWCAPTFDPTAEEPGLYADPTFRVGPAAFSQLLDLSILGFGFVQIPFRDAQLAGVLLEDGALNYTGVESGRFVGVIDARDLNIANACDSLGSVGLPCVRCPFDPESEACVVFVLDDLTTTVVPGVDVQVRTEADILADLDCL